MMGKLLYIINHMDWFWSHRLPLAIGAHEAGWSVEVAACGADEDLKLQDANFIGRALPSVRTAYDVLKAIASIRKIIIDTKPDLVHVITLKYAFMAGLAVRMTPHKLKIVHTVAGLGYLFSSDSIRARILRILVKPFLKIALNHERADVIVQNPDDRDVLVKRGFVQSNRCHLIRGSGVDTKIFPFVPEPETSPPLVIMPNRLVYDKGISIFIETAKILKKRGIDARFQIAGGISQSNPSAITKEEMAGLILGTPVEWLGRVCDMPDLYARSHLVLYPSWYGEGIPKVLLEAASTGRAIVTTDHPGCREAVTHGVNGYLVPIKDPNATADAVQELLGNKSMRLDMGKLSRKRATEEFDVCRIVSETLKVYDF